ncbi:type II toxin-antitoxin system RelE/ParE family toxin [Rudanella lutea]|uniref:type II toxin-antitoxin system RelE/ParE family toxin n=1 Tax=Rudanella lutea TaxID=451374 RepID=UPI0009FD49D8
MDTGTEIIWREEAREDLRDVLHFLSRSSLRYVQEWGELLDNKLSLLVRFPEMGRIVPEKSVKHLREIQVGRYRVLYIFLNDVITIIAIRHSASDISKLQ